MIVIAVEATRLGEQHDYAFLQQPALARSRDAASAPLDAFADAAFADYRARGAARPASPPAATSVQIYTLDVRP